MVTTKAEINKIIEDALKKNTSFLAIQEIGKYIPDNMSGPVMRTKHDLLIQALLKDKNEKNVGKVIALINRITRSYGTAPYVEQDYMFSAEDYKQFLDFLLTKKIKPIYEGNALTLFSTILKKKECQIDGDFLKNLSKNEAFLKRLNCKSYVEDIFNKIAKFDFENIISLSKEIGEASDDLKKDAKYIKTISILDLVNKLPEDSNGVEDLKKIVRSELILYRSLGTKLTDRLDKYVIEKIERVIHQNPELLNESLEGGSTFGDKLTEILGFDIDARRKIATGEVELTKENLREIHNNKNRNKKAIYDYIAYTDVIPDGDSAYGALISKINNTRGFFGDMLCQEDAATFSEYVMEKYPEASALCDIFSQGSGDLENAALRMHRAISQGKWSFWIRHSGAHWTVVAISPDCNAICLDSNSAPGKDAIIPSEVQNAIESVRKKSGKTDITTIKSLGLGTQRGMQCGLHACKAAEQIIIQLCSKISGVSSESLYLAKILNLFAENDFDLLRQFVSEGTRQYSKRDLELVEMAIRFVEDDELKEAFSKLFTKVTEYSQFAPLNGNKYIREENYTEIKELKDDLMRRIAAYQLTNRYKYNTDLTIDDIEQRVFDPRDPIVSYKTEDRISDEGVLDFRLEMAKQQLDSRIPQYIDVVQGNLSKSSTLEANETKKRLEEKLHKINFSKLIEPYEEFSKKPRTAYREAPSLDRSRLKPPAEVVEKKKTLAQALEEIQLGKLSSSGKRENLPIKDRVIDPTSVKMVKGPTPPTAPITGKTPRKDKMHTSTATFPDPPSMITADNFSISFDKTSASKHYYLSFAKVSFSDTKGKKIFDGAHIFMANFRNCFFKDVDFSNVPRKILQTVRFHNCKGTVIFPEGFEPVPGINVTYKTNERGKVDVEQIKKDFNLKSEERIEGNITLDGHINIKPSSDTITYKNDKEIDAQKVTLPNERPRKIVQLTSAQNLRRSTMQVTSPVIH